MGLQETLDVAKKIQDDSQWSKVCATYGSCARADPSSGIIVGVLENNKSRMKGEQGGECRPFKWYQSFVYVNSIIVCLSLTV